MNLSVNIYSLFNIRIAQIYYFSLIIYTEISLTISSIKTINNINHYYYRKYWIFSPVRNNLKHNLLMDLMHISFYFQSLPIISPYSFNKHQLKFTMEFSILVEIKKLNQQSFPRFFGKFINKNLICQMDILFWEMQYLNAIQNSILIQRIKLLLKSHLWYNLKWK